MAPSRLAIIGRYVLTPEYCFDRGDGTWRGGDTRLTHTHKHLLGAVPSTDTFEGTQTHTDDKLGFLQATVEYALRRDDLGSAFRDYLKTLDLG